MGKASDLVKRLEERPLQPGERWPVRPETRIRTNAPSVEVNETTSAENVLGQLDGESSGVVLRDANGEAKAVVLSAKRYAELASCEVESEDLFRTTLEGKIEPDPDALEELMVEQVNPADEWKFGSRIWRG